MPKHKPKVEKSQIDTFKKTAKALGCDPSEDRFQDALRRVAKARPSPDSRKDRTAEDGDD